MRLLVIGLAAALGLSVLVARSAQAAADEAIEDVGSATVWDGLSDFEVLGVTAVDNADANLAAFLMMIRRAEHHGLSRDGDYRRLYGATQWNGSMSTHPGNQGWTGVRLTDAQCAGVGLGSGCVSTAAGAYQFIKPTWNRVAKRLALESFEPACQDRAAVELIREVGALDLVRTGHVERAIARCNRTWASLSGAGYAGQREFGSSTLAAWFSEAGGIIS